MRAESGQDALETLNEIKLRGTRGRVRRQLRMPQISGIDSLEKAMDVYPLARRVLLTAYADTHAAIDAINVVDLDHHLLKPWDPPEEKPTRSSTACWRPGGPPVTGQSRIPR